MNYELCKVLPNYHNFNVQWTKEPKAYTCGVYKTGCGKANAKVNDGRMEAQTCPCTPHRPANAHPNDSQSRPALNSYDACGECWLCNFGPRRQQVRTFLLQVISPSALPGESLPRIISAL